MFYLLSSQKSDECGHNFVPQGLHLYTKLHGVSPQTAVLNLSFPSHVPLPTENILLNSSDEVYLLSLSFSYFRKRTQSLSLSLSVYLASISRPITVGAL